MKKKKCCWKKYSHSYFSNFIIFACDHSLCIRVLNCKDPVYMYTCTISICNMCRQQSGTVYASMVIQKSVLYP